MSISCWNSEMNSRHENIQSSITYIFVFYLISDVIVQFLRLKTRDCSNAILVRYIDVTSSCFMTSVYVRLTWRLCLQSWKIDSNSREMRWQHLRHFKPSERKWGRMKYPPQCLVGKLHFIAMEQAAQHNSCLLNLFVSEDQLTQQQTEWR